MSGRYKRLAARFTHLPAVIAGLMFSMVSNIAMAQGVTATVAAGATPGTIAVNPVTNRIYVANRLGASVTVIDGAANAPATVLTGTTPVAIAVNPVTNRIYVANYDSANVTVIDGGNNTTATVPAGVNPAAIAVNPVTNRIYVANGGSNSVTVIDGTNNTTTTIAVGTKPAAIAVNPVTNRAYVANNLSANVTVITGVSSVTATVAAGTNPIAIAVNAVTNKAYVANNLSGNVTVIDGVSNGTATVVAGFRPSAVAVNPVTNRIYVADIENVCGATCILPFGKVTVIDGTNNSTTTLSGVMNPDKIAVNPVTNKIYVSNGDRNSNGVTVIDGATNAISGISLGTMLTEQGGMAVNPVTNRLYVSRSGEGTVKVIDGTTNATATVAAGFRPTAVAVNPVTNRIYVADFENVCGANCILPYGKVTVIDGTNNSTTTLSGVMNPDKVVVNPVTNKIYVSNGDRNSNAVTVIDGATNAISGISLGSTLTEQGGMAVNPVTNRLYVSRSGEGTVKVIDGDTNATTTVTVGTSPRGIAVNAVTNRIYVVNSGSANVTVIYVYGATNLTTNVATGANPGAIAVNPVTGKVYVISGGNNVTVIDGYNNATATVATGTGPARVAVNPATNRIYVTNATSNNVTVIDGATNATTTVAAGTNPGAIDVNPVTNTIYVANQGSADVTVIDGATNTTRTVSAGTAPASIAVNPVTNRAYVANNTSSDVTVIDAAPSSFTNHGTTATLTGGSATSAAAPTLSFSVCCAYSPGDPAARTIYFRTGDAQGGFSSATGTGPYTASLAGLSRGLNYITLFAADAMEGTSTNTGAGASPMIGAPRILAVTVVDPPSFSTVSPVSPGTLGSAYSQSIAATGGVGSLTYAMTAGALPTGISLSAAGDLAGTPTVAGYFNFTVTVTDASGGATSQAFAIMVNPVTNAPRLGNISTRMQVLTGEDVLIGGFVLGGTTPKTVVVRARGPSLVPFGITNALANPVLQLYSGQTVIATNDDWQNASNAATLWASGFAPYDGLESAIYITLDPGSYTAIVTGAGGGTGVGIVEVFEVDSTEVPLANISTRGQVLTGNDVMIGGFVIQGTNPKTVIVRARGPSLIPYGIANALTNPVLQLFSGQTLIASNDDWGSAANAAAITASGFAPSDARESAILITLQPGAYTAIVTGSGGATGVGIVEVFAQ